MKTADTITIAMTDAIKNRIGTRDHLQRYNSIWKYDCVSILDANEDKRPDLSMTTSVCVENIER